MKSGLPARFAAPIWLLLVVIAALYLVSPSFTASHFEVLSAQIHINAIAANEHRLSRANVLYPIHTEYFYLSRIGVVYLVQLFAWIFDGDNAFRAVIVCSFAIYLASAAVVARRYAGISLLAALLAMLITPAFSLLDFSSTTMSFPKPRRSWAWRCCPVFAGHGWSNSPLRRSSAGCFLALRYWPARTAF